MGIVVILVMKWKWLTVVASVLLLVLLVAFVSANNSKTSFDGARELIVMRKIAHQILLYTGDSTTPVQSIEKISASQFKIPFATSFGFKPDSLVQIIDRVVRGYDFPSHYIVNVLEPDSQKVVFGYAMLGARQDDIIPCQGRDQPARQYYIMIQFQDPAESNKKWYFLGIGLLSVSLIALFAKLARSRKPLPASVEPVHDQPMEALPSKRISIGPYLFYPVEQYLLKGEQKTELTAKESRLLEIFASMPNQVVERNRLQKEVWEDEGVIVGRSLDVFVSKLRKKLEAEDQVKIINVHGKGYKLVIGE